MPKGSEMWYYIVSEAIDDKKKGKKEGESVG